MIIGTIEKHKAASDWSEALVFYSEVRTVSYKVSDMLTGKIKFVDKKEFQGDEDFFTKWKI